MEWERVGNGTGLAYIRRNGDDEKIREAHGEANKRTGIRVRRAQRDLEKLAWLERLCER